MAIIRTVSGEIKNTGYQPSISVTTPVQVKKRVFDEEAYNVFAKERMSRAEQLKAETESKIKGFQSEAARKELERRKLFVGKGRVINKGSSQFTARRKTQRKERFESDVSNYKLTAFEKGQEAVNAFNKEIDVINKQLAEYKPMKEITVTENRRFDFSGSTTGYLDTSIEEAAAEKGILIIKEKTPSGEYKIKDQELLIKQIISTPTPYPDDTFGKRQLGYDLYPELISSFGFEPQKFEYESALEQKTMTQGYSYPRANIRFDFEKDLLINTKPFDERIINESTLNRLVFEQGKQLALSQGFQQQNEYLRTLESEARAEAGGRLGSPAGEDYLALQEKEVKAMEAQAERERKQLESYQEREFSFRQARAEFKRRVETSVVGEQYFLGTQERLEKMFNELESERLGLEGQFVSRQAFSKALKEAGLDVQAYFGEVLDIPFLQGISRGRQIQTEIEWAGTPAQELIAGKTQDFLTGLSILPEVYKRQYAFVGEKTIESPFTAERFNFGYRYKQPVFENIFSGMTPQDLAKPMSYKEELEFRKQFGFREAIKAVQKPYTFEDLTGDLGRVGFDIVSGTGIGATLGGAFGGPAGIVPGAATGFVGGAVGGVADVTTRQLVFRQTGSEFLGETTGLITGIGVGFLSGATIEKSIARQFATRGVKAAPLSRIKTSTEMYPQLKSGSVDDLLESFYTGKPQQYFRQQFGFLDEGKPLAIRTTTKTTDISKIPQLAQYEEVAAFYGPDVSMIGLPQFGKQPRRFVLFGSPVQERGMIEVLEAKGVSRLPTEETFRTISFPQYKELRSFSGIELDRISGVTGSLSQAEFSGIKKGFRPVDLYFLESRLPGGRKQLMEAFVPTKAQPGVLYPSTQFQLGLSKEAEAVVFYEPNLFLERIGAKGVRQKVFGTPTAIFTEGSEYAGTRFYKPFTKTELENLGLARKTKIKYETFVARQQAKRADAYLRDYYSGFTRTPLITPGRLAGLGSVARAFDYRMPRQTYKAPRYDFRVPREFRQTTPRYTQTSYSDLPRMPTQREVIFRDFGYTPTRTPTYRPPKEPTYRDVPYYPPTRTPTYRPPREPTLRTPPMTPPTRQPTKRGKREEARMDYAQGSYHAFVRRDNNSKWVKATKKPLPYNAAFNQGLMVADNTVARSVKLKRVSKTYSGMDDPFIAEQKFRRRATRSKVPGEEIIFVEKNPFLIDTIGEKQGLKAAKYLKQKGGGFNWDFLKF